MSHPLQRSRFGRSNGGRLRGSLRHGANVVETVILLGFAGLVALIVLRLVH